MAGLETDFLVVGGGIAGVSCAEMLTCLAPESRVTLVTPTPVVKAITDFNHVTKMLASFNVVERGAADWEAEHTGVRVVQGSLTDLQPDAKTAVVSDLGLVRYRHSVCLCTGGSPRIVTRHPLVLGVRDTQSVMDLQDKLASAKRVMVLGNGGIATELVYELDGVQIIWVIRDDSINSAFVDPGAGEFLKDRLGGKAETDVNTVSKRMRFSVRNKEEMKQMQYTGSALGPDWHLGLDSKGQGNGKKVEVVRNSELKTLLSQEELTKQGLVPQVPEGWEEGSDESWPVFVQLSSGDVYGCDFVVSATGVQPNGDCFRDVLEVDAEGGVVVDPVMRTSQEGVYAAGDLISAGWDLALHWFQMRLWTQARHTGMQAAAAMVADATKGEIIQDFCFEMFAHVTKFFGYKVVLLGLFNGQKLDNQYDILLRMTRGLEYVKVVMKDGRMQGALLIGETELEETFENLILNQLDLTSYGEDLLDPNIDIDDYFD